MSLYCQPIAHSSEGELCEEEEEEEEEGVGGGRGGRGEERRGRKREGGREGNILNL